MHNLKTINKLLQCFFSLLLCGVQCLDASISDPSNEAQPTIALRKVKHTDREIVWRYMDSKTDARITQTKHEPSENVIYIQDTMTFLENGGGLQADFCYYKHLGKVRPSFSRISSCDNITIKDPSSIYTFHDIS